MTYIERLRDVNSRIGTTNIKGKEYAEVNQRILAFWELFPEGRIVTSCKTTDARCDCSCSVYRSKDDQEPAATGHAFEEKKGAINSTSYVENCETSAIGRALGILGIGSTQAIASKEELENALAQQQAKQQPKQQKQQQPMQRDYSKLSELKRRYAIATGTDEAFAGKSIVDTFGDPRSMSDAAYLEMLTAVEGKVSALEESNGK